MPSEPIVNEDWPVSWVACTDPACPDPGVHQHGADGATDLFVCVLCSEGFTLEGEGSDVQAMNPGQNAHRSCLLREVSGGIGHLLDHDTWCTARGDPDAGLDYRTSALLVDVLYRRKGVDWVTAKL